MSRINIQSYMTWRNAYRAYNGFAAAAATIGYFYNDDAAAIEYIPDIMIHAWEALCPDKLHGYAALANFARGGQSLWAFESGLSSIPPLANIIDCGNHTLNLLTRLHRILDDVKVTAEDAIREHFNRQHDNAGAILNPQRTLIEVLEDKIRLQAMGFDADEQDSTARKGIKAD
jgi:hypothetical protein